MDVYFCVYAHVAILLSVGWFDAVTALQRTGASLSDADDSRSLDAEDSRSLPDVLVSASTALLVPVGHRGRARIRGTNEAMPPKISPRQFNIGEKSSSISVEIT